MSAIELGKLEPVDLRIVWNNEASDFTPWLAEEKNLALLGDTIGLELELDSIEKNVGLFYADILCKDTLTNDWILIENQLERTDHKHLGQLLTYASSLNAVTIIWIARNFTDEHRAALDWLNEITNDQANFFGLEVELWRIGDSQIAPKFNVVSKPNEWTKSGGGGGRGELNELEIEQIAYWTKFNDLLVNSGSVLSPRKARPSYVYHFSIGRSGFRIDAARNSWEKRIAAILVIRGEQSKRYFHLLKAQKQEIEADFGETLEWMEEPEQITSKIAIRWFGADPSDRDQWPEQHKWLKQRLERFYEVFSPRIRDLDASDYIEAEEEEPIEP